MSAIHKLQTTHIQITTEQTKTAIKSAATNKSTGRDGINIQHLKHLGEKAIEYLTDIYNIALNTNNIPDTWKLAKIVPIHKPNKPTHLGTSYRQISLLSPIAKTLEKIILPYITSNIPDITTQHGFKKQHSTNTALHRINNIITTGFNQHKPPTRTVATALDMSKAFDTVNIYKLLQKTLNTNIPNTIIKFISNYTRARQAYTLYNNTKSKRKTFKTGVPQGGVLSPTLFNIYTSDIPRPPPNVQITTYADDITITSAHTNINTAQTQVLPYLQNIYNWTQDNNLQLNPDKSTSTLFTPDPAEYSTQLQLHINNTPIPTIKNPKILGLTFDPKLTYSTHIKQLANNAKKTLNILKALTSTSWGKDKETLTLTYKTIIRPRLEYANTIFYPIASDTQIHKLQIIDNTAKRIITGCTNDTATTHLHNETHMLPIKQHFKLHASLLKQKSKLPNHPLHSLIHNDPPPRHMKNTIYNTNKYTYNINTDTEDITEETIKENIKTIHTDIVNEFLRTRQHNPILNNIPPEISTTEQTLNRRYRRTLAQLRAGKSPILKQYMNKIQPQHHTDPHCPLCTNNTPHNTQHLFECPAVPTRLSALDLWVRPGEVVGLLGRWAAAMGWPGWG